MNKYKYLQKDIYTNIKICKYNLEWLQTTIYGLELILTFGVRENNKEGIQFLKNVI